MSVPANREAELGGEHSSLLVQQMYAISEVDDMLLRLHSQHALSHMCSHKCWSSAYIHVLSSATVTS